MYVDIHKGLYICRDATSDNSHSGSRQIRGFLNSLYTNGIDLDVVSVGGPCCNLLKSHLYATKEMPYRIPRFFFNHFFKNIIIPDIYRYTTNPHLLQKAKQVLAEHGNQYVISNSFPCSTHLVGREIKRQYGIPWIAQFFDPWQGNIHQNKKNNSFNRESSRLEELVAKEADCLIHTNKTIANDWRKRYGLSVAKKIRVVPLVYDGYIAERSVCKPKESVDLYYIGNINQNRNLNALIKALEKVLAKAPVVLEKIKIHLIGFVPHPQKHIITNSMFSNNFEMHGCVVYEKTSYYYHKADAFIVIDGDGDNGENLFFPSKLLDYFAYKKPILGITPKHGPTSLMLKEAGHCSFESSDINGIANYLIQFVSNPMSFFDFNQDYINNFMPSEIAKCFTELPLFR